METIKLGLNLIMLCLTRCDSLIVFKLPGWEESKGLKTEINKAMKLEMLIEEMVPSDEFLEKLSTISSFEVIK